MKIFIFVIFIIFLIAISVCLGIYSNTISSNENSNIKTLIISSQNVIITFLIFAFIFLIVDTIFENLSKIYNSKKIVIEFKNDKNILQINGKKVKSINCSSEPSETTQINITYDTF